MDFKALKIPFFSASAQRPFFGDKLSFFHSIKLVALAAFPYICPPSSGDKLSLLFLKEKRQKLLEKLKRYYREYERRTK
jgi:hypothetical protein